MISMGTVVEMGDDISENIGDRSLLLVNHQSTADVPLIMAALDGHEDGCRNIMWVMDRMFKRTNFGLVSWFHRDFFISSVGHFSLTLLSPPQPHKNQFYIEFYFVSFFFATRDSYHFSGSCSCLLE